ncbi:ATP-grasp fold amidoligase family protein [Anaerosacchariphilus polymeriproducens]|nr:ATP-grasp fold amidoligase family protein [Anaerosacchariphilus polymeriproducens]
MGCINISELRNDFRYFRRKLERKIAPIATLKYDFNKCMKKDLGKLDLSNVRSFSEKINWIKVYDNNPLYVECTDKYKVRNYVKKCGLEEILNDLYEVYDCVDEINLDKLPDKFVLKANHGCGWNIICSDKKQLDWSLAKKKLKKWMKMDYYNVQGEKWYSQIQRKIVCEQYLEDKKYKDLKDYKIFCFHGKPHVIQVDIDRYIGHKRNFYDTDWNLRDIYCEHDKYEPGVERPKKLEQMLEYAHILSEPFILARVDFYVVNDKIYFGEITFAPGSGVVPFEPVDFLYEMGNLMHLPEIKTT